MENPKGKESLSAVTSALLGLLLEEMGQALTFENAARAERGLLETNIETYLSKTRAEWESRIAAALEPDFKAYKIRNAEGEFSMGGAAPGSPGFVTLGKVWHTLGGVRAHITGWLRKNRQEHDAFVNGEIPWDVVTVHGYVADATPVRKFYGRGKATPDAPAEDEGNANDNQ